MQGVALEEIRETRWEKAPLIHVWSHAVETAKRFYRIYEESLGEHKMEERRAIKSMRLPAVFTWWQSTAPGVIWVFKCDVKTMTEETIRAALSGGSVLKAFTWLSHSPLCLHPLSFLVHTSLSHHFKLISRCLVSISFQHAAGLNNLRDWNYFIHLTGWRGEKKNNQPH